MQFSYQDFFFFPVPRRQGQTWLNTCSYLPLPWTKAKPWLTHSDWKRFSYICTKLPGPLYTRKKKKKTNFKWNFQNHEFRNVPYSTFRNKRKLFPKPSLSWYPLNKYLLNFFYTLNMVLRARNMTQVWTLSSWNTVRSGRKTRSQTITMRGGRQALHWRKCKLVVWSPVFKKLDSA